MTVVMGVNHDKYDPANHHIVSKEICAENMIAMGVADNDKAYRRVIAGGKLAADGFRLPIEQRRVHITVPLGVGMIPILHPGEINSA